MVKTGECEKYEKMLTKEQFGHSRKKLEMREKIAVDKELKDIRSPPMDTASTSHEPPPDPPSSANVVPDPVPMVYVQETSTNIEVHLTHCPDNPVGKEIYIYYRLLVLLIAHLIDYQQLHQLIVWARQHVIVANRYSQVWEVFYQLDRENLTNSSNLTRPLAFFQWIERFDIVHLIDKFLAGNYTFLDSVDISSLPAAPRLDYFPVTEPGKHAILLIA